MARAYNFSAGPAALPESVLQRARDEMLDYQGRGLSVMEMSHRSAEFIDIAERAESRLRALLAVPDDYRVLFLQGGATLQFSAIPLNLSAAGDTVAYVNTGAWSTKAIEEARRFAHVAVVASSEDSRFDRVPPQDSWQVPDASRYLHICLNETIGGVEFPFVPDCGDMPLVADVSSTLLSRPLDVSRFGVLYGGAQKNIGPAGLTLVIVRDDLLGGARADCPSLLDWSVQAKADSMSNTPPTFAWYLAGLVFDWVHELGGLQAMGQINQRKAATLYDAIEASNFYAAPVEEACRSWMNVPFTLADAELDKAFLAGAEARGLLNLKGHRSVGGMRASLYNAVSQEAVDALVAYMGEFEAQHA